MEDEDMTDGLQITEEQFMKLKAKDQNRLIFKNTQHIMKDQRSHNFHFKVLYAGVVFLSGATLWLLNMLWEHIRK
jgi:hypothetical protein